LLALVSFVVSDCGHYDYQDPDVEWPTLDCGTVQNQCDNSIWHNQSPVLIMSGNDDNTLKPLGLNGYEPFNGTVINNGHAVSIVVPPDYAGNFNGYTLIGAHMHSLAENVVYPHGQEALAIHFVHSNPAKELAVLSLTLRPIPLSNVTFDWLRPVVNVLSKVSALGNNYTTEFGSLQTTFDELVASQMDGYYTFNGSLTTPPCTEGVTWYILDTTAVISREDMDKFIAIIGGQNNRPVQRTLEDVSYFSPGQFNSAETEWNTLFLRSWAGPATLVVVVIGLSICILLIILIVISKTLEKSTVDDNYAKM